MLHSIHTKAGKVTIVTVLLSLFAVCAVFFFDVQHGGHIQRATADVATTSVTVLNIPPAWTVHAVESPASTSTSPTNVGSVVTFQATGTDGNNEKYYLLICKTATTAVPHQGAAPDCGTAANQWAVSASTTSGTPATATYAASSTDSETEDWFAYICDGNAGNPACNAASSGDGSADNKSPFSVNHRPTFTFLWDDSPTLPDGTTTWTATSSDADTSGGNDQVKLYICTTSNFTAGVGCDDGTRATSTLSASDPTAAGVISAPIQDGNYNAYGFVVDEHDFAASGGAQGTDSTLTVANATPTISNVSVNSGIIILSTEQGETSGFAVTFDVSDTNSCVANGSTTSEILAADINVYRSGVGSTTCDESGEHDSNNCYTGTRPITTWNVSCSQDAGTCLGPADETVSWTCTYPLWYVADPTDAGAINSPHETEVWLATALAGDDNGATSTLVEDGFGGKELQQFLSFNVGTTSIAYGSYQPGFGNASTSRPTDISATGNTGLDENLSGNDMCTTYPSCTGDPTNTIPADQQHFATSTVAYALGTALATTTKELEINLNKTTSTSTPATTNTYWGIFVPGAITLSGDYVGVNTLEGKTAETVDW
ncbi:MAG: hypothetical protein KAS07_03385 [Candidatus Pacebacteria bacterium]|nr:hypothetical protein [Candidatus Paceibacterota bacterium]